MSGVVCDLVLLSYNAPAELAACVEGLLAHTDVPSRLIIVDNASEPSVRAWLQGVQPRGYIREVVLLQNERNEGFARGMNRGIKASHAPYVCLLNNDIVAAPGWLSRMIEVAEAHPELGILNPGSNAFGDRPPRGRSLAEHARLLGPRRGMYVEVGSCIGFCLLIKREVVERVGLLDETIGPFFYEDDDYCARARAAGFHCGVVPAAYVVHHEHRTVRGLPRREEIFQESRRRFEAKWGRRLRVAYLPSSPQDDVAALRATLDRAVALARRGGYVRLFLDWRSPNGTDVFTAAGLVPHADVSIYKGGRLVLIGRCLGMVLTRRRKPFDVVLTDDPGFARLVRWLAPLHRAEVLSSQEPERLETIWKTRCHSPL